MYRELILRSTCGLFNKVSLDMYVRHKLLCLSHCYDCGLGAWRVLSDVKRSSPLLSTFWLLSRPLTLQFAN